jgi:transcriptional regulator with XRE-family HTH domain
MLKKGLPIIPEVLKWARESAGYHAVEELNRSFPKLSEWEQGISQPSYLQLEQLAKKYKRPTAVFFFPLPPKELPIEKSLRSSEVNLYNLSPTIRFLYRKAKVYQIYLQELFSEEYKEQLQKISWLKFETNTSIEDAAKNIRKKLHISLYDQRNWKNTEQALERWRELLAENGVYVFKDAFYNKKVSGFCIYDEIFPIIFINNSHSESRQIFTIFHELGHLIFKQNYLDSYENFWKLKQRENFNIEAKCNMFASNFLI